MAERMNELDRKNWLKYSISIWSDIRRTAEERKLNHPASFPEQLVHRIIQCYTTEEDSVILDPFAGTGTTLVVAQRAGKHGIGFEIYNAFAEIIQKRIARAGLWNGDPPELVRADAREMTRFLEPDSVDLVVTSPPYWDVLNRPRKVLKPKRDWSYGDSELDLGNIPDYSRFLGELERVFREVKVLLKPERFCVVIVMDLRKNKEFYPYHADLMRIMEGIGFVTEDIFIWDRRHEYHGLVPFGYPSSFHAFKAHEYILVFRKPATPQ